MPHVKWGQDVVATHCPIVAALGKQASSLPQYQKICVDTRKLKMGDLFFALPGARVDGHHFLERAAGMGAVGAVVSSNYRGPSYGMPLFPVDNPLHSLQELARQTLVQRNSRILSVTGSVGKTTIKNFLKDLLTYNHDVAASPGNSNSQIGLPLAILNATSGKEELLVLEMGMSQAGEIRRLTEIAPPDIAIIGTVALSHAENFDSLEAIGRAKAEILSHPQTRVGILCRDICIYNELNRTSHCDLISFSLTHPKADYRLELVDDRIDIVEHGTKHQLGTWSVEGTHNQHNLLAAIAAARAAGTPWASIQKAFSALKLPERRLERLSYGGIHFLNDSYNASELSMKAALDLLKKETGRRLAILGPMPELGKFSEGCHRRVGEYALDCADQLFCLGEECLPMLDSWHHSGKEAIHFTEYSKLVDSLHAIIKKGDTLLLKGANRMRLWELIDELGKQ